MTVALPRLSQLLVFCQDRNANLRISPTKFDFLSVLFSVFTANLTVPRILETGESSGTVPSCQTQLSEKAAWQNRREIESWASVRFHHILHSVLETCSVAHSRYFHSCFVNKDIGCYATWPYLCALFRLQAGEIIDKEGKVYSLCCYLCDLVLVLSSHVFRAQVNSYWNVNVPFIILTLSVTHVKVLSLTSSIMFKNKILLGKG